MLLGNLQFSEQLFVSISDCKQSFVACSAFIKAKALKHKKFTDNLAGKNVIIVARWQKHDLLAEASDLEVYELCKNRGWRFGINFNLHMKLFLIDKQDIFLGSANLTQKGLHIGVTGNHEIGTKIPAGQADLEKINNFIESEVTWMTDDLYKLISNEIHESKKEEAIAISTFWSKAIDDMVRKSVKFLWVQELVFMTPSELLNFNLDDERAIHDFDLLGLNIDDICEESLKRSFKQLRLYKWMCSTLDEESLSFGSVTARLHSAILDDPKPYRMNIKTYNQILFKWAEFIDDIFEVTRPNYSQVLSLKSE